MFSRAKFEQMESGHAILGYKDRRSRISVSSAISGAGRCDLGGQRLGLVG